MSEDALLDLSDKFEKIDDEDADSIASHLNMSIELRQDGNRGAATKKMKQFNKACKDALKGKPIKSAFEGVVTEAFKKGDKVKYLGHPGIITNVSDYNGKTYYSVSYNKGTGKTKARMILSTDGSITEAKLTEDKAMKAIIKAPKGTEVHGGGHSPFTKLGHNSWKNYKTKTLAHDKEIWKRFTGFRDFELKKGKVKYFAIGGHQFEGKLNESMIGIQTKANFKPNTLKGALERAGMKGFQMNRLSVTMTALKLDKKDFEKAKKIIDAIPTAKIMTAKESVNEATSLWKAFDAKMKLQDEIMDLEMDMKMITKDLSQLHKDMEQEAEPEGGKVATRYGRDIEKKEKEYKKKKAEFKKLMKKLDKMEQY